MRSVSIVLALELLSTDRICDIAFISDWIGFFLNVNESTRARGKLVTTESSFPFIDYCLLMN